MPLLKKKKKKNFKKKSMFDNFRKNKIKVEKPKTTQEIIKMFFDDFDNKTNLFKISGNVYSMCLEYTDISFAKASNEEAEDIFLKYVEYLNGFNDNTHIQIVNSGIPKRTEQFKKEYIYDTNIDNPNVKRVAEELNTLIENALGDKKETLESRRYIVLSQESDNFKKAYSSLFEMYLKTEEKFKELGSRIRVVSNKERLDFLYNIINSDIVDDNNFGDISEYAKKNNLTVFDMLAPREMKLGESDDYIVVDGGKKYISALYVKQLSTSLKPTFYNRLTTSQNLNLLTTLNIQPQKTAKAIKRLGKKITGMKSEKIAKKKSAGKNGLDYEDIKDENLEEKLKSTKDLLNAIKSNNQKVYSCNTIIIIMADSIDKLNKDITKIYEIGDENFVTIRQMKWQQLEGIQHALPLGWNKIQFQRTLHSEAVAINVPFNSKDIMQKDAIYYGINLVSKNPIFADKRTLLNGNGCILSTSGGGKSFAVKTMIEQIYLRYPNDDIICVDPQNEYYKMIEAYKGQTIEISATTDTHINPFDLDLNYDDKEPIKMKTEYVIAFIESLYGNGLTGGMISIIDRVTKTIFEPYELSGFSDVTLIPTFKTFYDELKNQLETEAKELCLTLERYINGSMDIFSKDTNVNISNRLVSFVINQLPESIRTTGYLVILDYIQNTLARNKKDGKYTHIIIDEFHILLPNKFGAEYVAKIYKTGRKFNAFPIIITQNIADVLENEQGRKILSNSEFALLLKQKPLDLPAICSIFNISPAESTYLSKAGVGTGILVFGEDKYPFKNVVPRDSYIYHLNKTSQTHVV